METENKQKTLGCLTA